MTAAPVTMTAAPVTMTAAPVTMTAAPVTMTAAPVTMTAAPSRTDVGRGPARSHARLDPRPRRVCRCKRRSTLSRSRHCLVRDGRTHVQLDLGRGERAVVNTDLVDEAGEVLAPHRVAADAE